MRPSTAYALIDGNSRKDIEVSRGKSCAPVPFGLPEFHYGGLQYKPLLRGVKLNRIELTVFAQQPSVVLFEPRAFCLRKALAFLSSHANHSRFRRSVLLNGSCRIETTQVRMLGNGVPCDHFAIGSYLLVLIDLSLSQRPFRARKHVAQFIFWGDPQFVFQAHNCLRIQISRRRFVPEHPEQSASASLRQVNQSRSGGH